MSAIQTKIKTIVFTALSAAVLAACGGGGNTPGGAAALSTGSTNTGSSGSSSSSSSGSSASSGTSASSGSTVSTDSSATASTAQNTGALSELQDVAPLDPLNLNTPLHTQFISSATAQQGNPNVQLRRNSDGVLFMTDSANNNQNGLISSLDFNANDEVKLDGVVIANRDATQVEWATPRSFIAKVFSGGSTQTDISKQDGDNEPNTRFGLGRYSADDYIAELRTNLESARTALAQAQAGNDQDAIVKAQAKVEELAALYDLHRQYRSDLAGYTADYAAGLAYFKKDKDGLVFDKRFDGVYIVRFLDGTQIVMHDPAAAGWTYQTFAHYTDPKNGVIHGYQSLGDETRFADLPASGTATYRGLTTAFQTKNDVSRQLTADVTAIADFARKGVRFETSGSQFHTLDANGFRVSTPDASYDMKGTAQWSNGNLFTGTVATANGLSGNLNGKFYGANAAEIGGTYGLAGGDARDPEHLIGGYGAKRQ